MMSAPLPAGQPPLAVSVFAAVIASRNVQSGPPVPPLFVFTVIVAARATGAGATTSRNANSTSIVENKRKVRTGTSSHGANLFLFMISSFVKFSFLVEG
jgi:hypothetical protein